MGLDQYASSRHKDSDPELKESWKEIAYWRKHPNLQGWMEKRYREQGGKEEFNQVDVDITAEVLDQLVKDLDNLPDTQGFFYGASDPGDRDLDIDFILKARQALAEDHVIIYSSWW